MMANACFLQLVVPMVLRVGTIICAVTCQRSHFFIGPSNELWMDQVMLHSTGLNLKAFVFRVTLRLYWTYIKYQEIFAEMLEFHK